MPETTLAPEQVRISAEEASWLTAAAKGAVTQNDLLRLALHRRHKDLGAASRIKPETVQAAAKAYKLTPPRTAASKPVSPATKPSGASGGARATPDAGARRARVKPSSKR